MTELAIDLAMLGMLLVSGFGILAFHLWHMERDKQRQAQRRQGPAAAE